MSDATATIAVLIQLYIISAVMTVVMEQIFDTQAYHMLIGKGVNGKPSWLLPNMEIRPYIATAAGIFVAMAANLQFLSQGLQIDMSTGIMGAAGAYFDCIITGIMLGGGSKTVKRLSKGITSARNEVTE